MSCSEVNFPSKLFIAWRNWVHRMLKLERPSKELLLNISNNCCLPRSQSWQETRDDKGITFNRCLFFLSHFYFGNDLQGQSAVRWRLHEMVKNSEVQAKIPIHPFLTIWHMVKLLSFFEAKFPKLHNEDDITNMCWVVVGSRCQVCQGSQHYGWLTEVGTSFFQGY